MAASSGLAQIARSIGVAALAQSRRDGPCASAAPARATRKAPARAQRSASDRSIGAQDRLQPVVGDIHLIRASGIRTDVVGVEDDFELLAGPAVAIRFAEQLGEVGGLQRLIEAGIVDELLLEVRADELAHYPKPLFARREHALRPDRRAALQVDQG